VKDLGVDFNSDPLPEAWRQAYLKRPIEKLPADLVHACDELRAQRRDIDTLRGQVSRAKKRLWKELLNLLLVGVFGGGTVKGLEFLIHHLKP
jgi:hypothetical protein